MDEIKVTPDTEDGTMSLSECNPWAVANLETFVYYHCPECALQNQSKDLFINHAILNHPKVTHSFLKFASMPFSKHLCKLSYKKIK